MAQHHKHRHAELTGTFPVHIIQDWEATVAAWINDPRTTNPYVEPVISELSNHLQRPLISSISDTSMATLRLELAKEETVRTEETMPHEMSPSAFLQMGLDLEDQQ